MTEVKTKISALLITLNEEENMADVLANLKFADEIIVVDSYSTDDTAKIAKATEGVTFIQREFKNYTDQKNFALQQAKNDWVVFIDADERMPQVLIDEVLVTINSDQDNKVAYFFYRTFMFKNKKLRFSGWQTDKNYRLFRKSKVKFDQNRIVHETLIVNGNAGILKSKLLHYSYKNYEDYKSKMVKYGKMKAMESFKKGKKTQWYHFTFRPLYKFLNHYFLRLGILDGTKGVIICYLNALGVYSRYRELKRLNTGN